MSIYNHNIALIKEIVMDKKLLIKKRNLKGEDGYKVFSVRIKEETVDRLEVLAKQSNRSRNDLIGTLLDFALDNCEVISD